MASNKIKGLTIQIGADTLGLDTALKGVEKKAREVSGELRDVNKTIKTAGDTAALWNQKQKLLNDALEESKKKLQLLEDAQEQVARQLSEKKIGEDQYRAFIREVESAKAEVTKYEKSLSEANDKVKELGDESSETSKDVKELGDKAEGAADGGINVMTVALGNLVADGIKLAGRELKNFAVDVVRTGADFESGMSSVAAISGATSAELEELTAKAEEMGSTTKFTAKEASDAFSYMAMAGWKVEDMLGGIEGVLNLAAASGEDLGTTSDIVTDAMTAFGLSADKAGHFADVLAAASSNANTNVRMMGETFKYVAPVAGALNYNIEDTAEAIGLMANAGIKSTQAGTALRSIITRLSTDAGASANKLGALGTLTEELGVQFYKADGSARAFGEVIADTREKWQGLNAEQQTAYGKAIAGTEAISGWLALMNAAPEDVAKLSGAIRECDGAAGSMSATMQDNLQGDMTKLESAVDGMKIRLAKDLSPAMRDVVQYLTRNMPEVEKTLSGLFTTAANGIVFIVKNLPKIASAVKTVAPVIGTAIAGLLAYKLYERTMNLITALTSLSGPQGAIVIAATAATALAAAISVMAESHNKEADAIDKVVEEYSDERKAVDELRESMNAMKDDYSKRANTIVNEAERTKSLWKELDSLADSTGKVKDADKKRAEYILGELSEALGQEYTMTGNQIDRYKEMESEIESLIEKKQAAALLDAYLEQGTDFTKAQKESFANYQKAYANEKIADERLRVLEAEIKEYVQKNLPEIDEALNGDYSESHLAGYFQQIGTKVLGSDLEKLADEYLATRAEKQQNTSLKVSYRTAYQEAIDYQEKLHDAETAYAQGNYSNVSDILYNPNYGRLSELESETDLEKRKQLFEELLAETKGGLNLALENGSNYAVADAIADMVEALEAGQKAGEIAGEKAGENFRKYFSDEINEMLDKGFDISDLIEWGKNSGLKVGDVFEKDFRSLVQAQIDGGFDARNLIHWGGESGALVGEDYNSGFGKKISDYLASFDPDITGLIEWAKDKGIEIGELFSANFNNYFELYGWSQPGRINEYSINSQGDYDYWKKHWRDTKESQAYFGALGTFGKYATGGFVGIGGTGIVAEAGPELLQVMNGGVKITPLTNTVTNVPAESYGAGQKVVSIVNKIYATIKDSYDVRRLAEDLATEERMLETAKGL